MFQFLYFPKEKNYKNKNLNNWSQLLKKMIKK